MMPRRLAIIVPRISLFLITTIAGREVKKAGEELMRIVVKKAKGHYYNVSIRTRSVNRELRASVPRAGIPDIFEMPT